jgi:predicted  nucleic acid-binding Zn-ribbon protein
MASMSDATPERTPMPAPPSDEISLRELYLVLRRGAGWIVGATVLMGLAAFLFLSTRPAQFKSEAVVVYEAPPVSAPPVSVRGGDAFAASLVTSFSYDAYEALAFDRLRLAEVLAAVPEVDWSVDQLISRANLERRSAANAAVLTVVHAVQAASPEVAAAVAQAWADFTTAAVRETIRGRVADSQTVSDRVAELRANLEVAEDALLRFTAGDEAQQLRARESSLIQRLQSLDGRRAEVLVELAVLVAERAERDAEVATLATERSTLTATGEAAFAGASAGEVVARASARAVEAEGAWRSAADALAVFDGATPLGLWEAELASLTQRLQALDGQRAAALVELAGLSAERGARASDVEVLRVERSTLTATGEAAFAGASAGEVVARASARAVEAEGAWRSAADALAVFDGATPLGLWEAELAATRSSITQARTTRERLIGDLAEVRSQLVAATQALGRIPAVATLQTALIDASVLADVLAGDADFGDRVAVTETQNPVRVESEQAFELLLRDVARLEAALADLDRRIPELERREADLRARLAVGSADRSALEREVGVLASLARELVATAQAVDGSSGEVRLAPSSRLAEAEAALRTVDRRVAALEAEVRAVEVEAAAALGREADLRARLAVGSADRSALEREVGVLASLARDLALTAQAVEGSPSDVRLAPSSRLAEAEAALRTVDRRIAALRAEVDAVATALATATGELTQVRAERAALELQRTRLQRDYEFIEGLYSDIAALTPSLEVIEVLAPMGVRILSAAYVPARAEASRALLVSLLAAVVAAFGAVVLLLLREAVAAPAGSPVTGPPRPRVQAPAG